MFQALSRKRSLDSSEIEAQSTRLPTSALPFSGVVVCLSGLPAEYKGKLHKLVNEMGGSFTRDLDTSRTTHLIASVPDGAKYDTARSCPHIHIVDARWIEETASSGRRAKEENFPIIPPSQKILPQLSLDSSLDCNFEFRGTITALRFLQILS